MKRVREGDLSHRLPDADGELQRVVAGFNELAAAAQETLREREEAARELELSRAHARALFEACPVGLALVRPEGQVLDRNPAFASLRLEDDAGASLLERADERPRAELSGLLALALERGGAGPIELELTTQEDTRVPVRLLARRVLQGDLHLVLLGAEDVTERRRLQARALESQKLQVVGQLASGVAHDFNNLLTAIMGSADCLSLQITEKRDQDLLDCIGTAADRGAALTQQLLSFSRRSAGRPTRLSVVGELHDAQRLLQRLLHDDIQLSLSVADQELWVRGAEGQLTQIVMNLVLNARDAMPEGGTIEVSATPHPDGVRLSVSDPGVGIPDDVRARLFEPFFTTKSTGTGLGLATVLSVVQELGGTIDVVSTVGEGSTFLVDLPLCAEDVESEPPSSSPAPLTHDPEGVVLVVDDDPLVRSVAVSTLLRQGLEAEGAAGGVEGVARARDLGPRCALLLTDVVMPDLGGRAVADRVRAFSPNLPVLFMSGYNDDDVLRHGVQESKVEFLRKPFTAASLLAAVRRAVAIKARS